MIMRIDRLQTELPPPSDPDPVGAAVVQELLGGKFGEMSTFMNYTYQSFNFRNRQGARPFYDLVASIAAEEFGHIELVSAAINTMLTGAGDGEPGDARRRSAASRARRNTQQFIAGGAAALVQDSMGKPWNGRQRVLLRRPRRGPHAQLLPRDRRAQQQAQGLRDGRPSGGPGAHRLSCWCAAASTRSPTHARSRTSPAPNLMKLFPSPNIPTDKIPECRPHIKRRPAPDASTAGRTTTSSSSPPSSTARTRRPARSSSSPRRSPRGRAGERPAAPDGGLRPRPRPRR